MFENEQYAHVLLFSCPRCQRALVAACLSDNKSLETAETKGYDQSCLCDWTGDLSGVTAIKHWVEPWRGKVLAPGEAGSCDVPSTDVRLPLA